MFIILAILYPLAVQFERGGWWRLLAPVTFIAFLIDVWCNYTELALIFWDFPRRNEFTFSVRLRRLQHDEGWRGKLARPVVAYLNFFYAGHVPN